MEQTTQLSTLFAHYDRLCQYCDALFQQTYQAFPTEMQCQKGCAECCALETVVPLEAAVISVYLDSLDPIERNRVFSKNPVSTSCVFLSSTQICLIYPVRPLICRTHGLPIAYPDRTDLDACPLNFANIDLTQIDRQYVLDAENITTNLLRLNLAYALLRGDPDRSGERVPLRTIFEKFHSEHSKDD